MSVEPKLCQECGATRPKGRSKYCGDVCSGVAVARRTRAKDDKRLTACSRCQGPKEPGTRGGKYCAECRRIVADTSEQMEYERGRRRNLANIAAKLERGERVKKRRTDVPEGHKWCARCQSFRPLSSFPKRSGDRTHGVYCIPCQRGYNRERWVRVNFGITWDEYESLLADQNFRCAICGGKPRKHALAVDHDHRTGEIRGLLCSRCNHRLLGAANDDPARLRKAADYLEVFTPREVFGEAKFVPGAKGQDGAA